MEMWELIAREQIRDTLARYNWAGDAGRLDGLTETFARDGVLEIRGTAAFSGRSEILAFLSAITEGISGAGGSAAGTRRSVVRHNLANVLFDDVTPVEARVSSYFTVVTHIGLDHFGRYRDILVPHGDRWLIKHRKVTTDWAAPDSAMARR